MVEKGKGRKPRSFVPVPRSKVPVPRSNVPVPILQGHSNQAVTASGQTAFTRSLAATLYNRLLLSMCFTAIKKVTEMGVLRVRLTLRLYKLRRLNLMRTSFVGFLMCHVRASRLKKLAISHMYMYDARLLGSVVDIWRAWAVSKVLKRKAGEWCTTRHYVSTSE